MSENKDLMQRLAAAEAEVAAVRAELAKAKEPEPWTRWKPKEKGTYWFTDTIGGIRHYSFCADFFDEGCYNLGNCFPTREAAERHAKRIRSMVPTCPVPQVGDECWWVNNDFHAFRDKWVNGTADREMYLGGRVFATEEAAKAWIAEFADAWTTLEDAS